MRVGVGEEEGAGDQSISCSPTAKRRMKSITYSVPFPPMTCKSVSIRLDTVSILLFFDLDLSCLSSSHNTAEVPSTENMTAPEQSKAKQVK